MGAAPPGGKDAQGPRPSVAVAGRSSKPTMRTHKRSRGSHRVVALLAWPHTSTQAGGAPFIFPDLVGVLGLRGPWACAGLKVIRVPNDLA